MAKNSLLSISRGIERFLTGQKYKYKIVIIIDFGQ
jgi:hypothetical protein